MLPSSLPRARGMLGGSLLPPPSSGRGACWEAGAGHAWMEAGAGTYYDPDQARSRTQPEKRDHHRSGTPGWVYFSQELRFRNSPPTQPYCAMSASNIVSTASKWGSQCPMLGGGRGACLGFLSLVFVPLLSFLRFPSLAFFPLLPFLDFLSFAFFPWCPVLCLLSFALLCFLCRLPSAFFPGLPFLRFVSLPRACLPAACPAPASQHAPHPH